VRRLASECNEVLVRRSAVGIGSDWSSRSMAGPIPGTAEATHWRLQELSALAAVVLTLLLAHAGRIGTFEPATYWVMAISVVNRARL
jgi:hypothetical protein